MRTRREGSEIIKVLQFPLTWCNAKYLEAYLRDNTNPKVYATNSEAVPEEEN